MSGHTGKASKGKGKGLKKKDISPMIMKIQERSWNGKVEEQLSHQQVLKHIQPKLKEQMAADVRGFLKPGSQEASAFKRGIKGGEEINLT